MASHTFTNTILWKSLITLLIVFWDRSMNLQLLGPCRLTLQSLLIGSFVLSLDLLEHSIVSSSKESLSYYTLTGLIFILKTNLGLFKKCNQQTAFSSQHPFGEHLFPQPLFTHIRSRNTTLNDVCIL